MSSDSSFSISTPKDASELVDRIGIDHVRLLLDEDVKRRGLGLANKHVFSKFEDRDRLLKAIGEALEQQRAKRENAEAELFQEAVKQRLANEQAANAATESVALASRSIDIARRDLEAAVAGLDVAKMAYKSAIESNNIASNALVSASRSAQAAEDGVEVAKSALIAAERSAAAAEKSASTADKQSRIAVWAAVAAAVSALISLFGLFAEKPPVIVHAPAQQAQSHSGASKSGWRAIETTHQLAPTIGH